MIYWCWGIKPLEGSLNIHQPLIVMGHQGRENIKYRFRCWTYCWSLKISHFQKGWDFKCHYFPLTSKLCDFSSCLEILKNAFIEDEYSIFIIDKVLPESRWELDYCVWEFTLYVISLEKETNAFYRKCSGLQKVCLMQFQFWVEQDIIPKKSVPIRRPASVLISFGFYGF